jgi:hypothetical protein
VELAASLAATVCIDHMRESRDSKICVLAAGREISRWEGESAPAFRDSLLDLLAGADGGPAPAIERLLDEAAAQRGPGTAVILISSRDRGFATDALEKALAERKSNESLGDAQVIRTDPSELASFFELV